MVNKRDYYDVLGISKQASNEDIKRAYRKLALEWHPDRNKSPEAESRFKEINEAYAVLSDTQKRQTYDQFGHSAFQPGQPSGSGSPFGEGFRQGPFSYYYSTGDSSGNPFSGTDFIDPFEIFEQFFGGGFTNRSRHQRNVYKISIEFADAMHGSTKDISIPRGQAGEGSQKVSIKIPPGVDTGSRIRFDDFDILIEVKPDNKFKREGNDLIIDQEISIPTAVLGGVVEVPTIDEPIKIKIMPGTQPDTIIRLRGKGAPYIKSRNRGDQYVRLKVVIPKHPSKETKKHYEELSKIS